MLHLHGCLETAAQIYFIFLYRFWVVYDIVFLKTNAVYTYEIAILIGFAHIVPANSDVQVALVLL